MDAAHTIILGSIDKLLEVYHTQANQLDIRTLLSHPKKRSRLKKLLRETVGMMALKTCCAHLPSCTPAQALAIANELLSPSTKPVKVPKPKQAPKRAKRTQPQANNHISINSLEP